MPQHKTDPNLVTQADFARVLGVSRQTVGKWKGQGLLVMVEDGTREWVDHTASRAAVAAFQNPLKSQNSAGNGSRADSQEAGPDISGADPTSAQGAAPAQDTAARVVKHARAQKETADARLANLKYQKASGQVVPRIEVEGVGPVAAALLHQAMSRRRVELSRALFAAKTEREMITLLKKDDYALLSSFADGLLGFDGIAQPQEDAAAA